MRNYEFSDDRNRIICERIDEVMREKNVSNADLSRKMYGNDKSKAKISKWRHKENCPRMEVIPEIAKVLRLFRSLLIRRTRYKKY